MPLIKRLVAGAAGVIGRLFWDTFAARSVRGLRSVNPRIAHDRELQRCWGRARRLVPSPAETVQNMSLAVIEVSAAVLSCWSVWRMVSTSSR